MPNTFPNDQLMVRYLLGESLSETEQSELEALLFSGTDFVEQLQALELELVERYERGELGAHERGLFEKRFLNPPERRDLLTFVRTLSHIVEEQSKTSAVASVVAKKAFNSERTWLPRWNPFVGWSKRELVRAALLVAAVIPLGALIAVLDYPFSRDIAISPVTPTVVRREPPAVIPLGGPVAVLDYPLFTGHPSRRYTMEVRGLEFSDIHALRLEPRDIEFSDIQALRLQLPDISLGILDLEVEPRAMVESILQLPGGKQFLPKILRDKRTPLLMNLPAGTYLVRVAHPQLGRFAFPVEIAPGKIRRVVKTFAN